jgi:signal transduction histidine kinase
MLGGKDRNTTAGTLTYNGEWNCLELDGYPLQCGDRIEVSVFGYWIPGQIALDTAGWYLITLDQAEIRLNTALTARFCETDLSRTETFHPAQTSTPHILIVDDDPALLQALPHTVSLRIPEAEIDTSALAEEALEQIQEHDYDAIMSDIKMPGMDGLELLAKVHELRPDTPALLITGHGDHDLAIQALRGGAYDYILKPIDRDYVAAALRRAIQTRQLRRQVVEQQLALELHSRSLEHLVQQRTSELVEANAMKDKVISLVSQELATPLARLKEVTQLVRQKLESADMTEVVSQGFVDIEQSISRTEMLVQDLVDTSRIEATEFILHRQRYDLVELCRNVLEKHATATGSTLTCERLGAVMEAEVDVDRISQLLLNLLSNAREYSTRGSPITVTLQQAGHQAIITVSKIGLPPESGLWFYTSHKIVELHRGRLEIQNFPENRSAIFIILPLRVDSSTEDTNEAMLTWRTLAGWSVSA